MADSADLTNSLKMEARHFRTSRTVNGHSDKPAAARRSELFSRIAPHYRIWETKLLLPVDKLDRSTAYFLGHTTKKRWVQGAVGGSDTVELEMRQHLDTLTTRNCGERRPSRRGRHLRDGTKPTGPGFGGCWQQGQTKQTTFGYWFAHCYGASNVARPICLRCQQRQLDCLYDDKQAPASVEAVAAELGSSHTPPLEPLDNLQTLTPARTLAEASQAARQGDRNASAANHFGQAPSPKSLSWLVSSELPDNDGITILWKSTSPTSTTSVASASFTSPRIYNSFTTNPVSYNNRAPCCMSYVLLEPSDSLVRFYALKCRDRMNLPNGFAISLPTPSQAGNSWAKRAKVMLTSDMNNVSVQIPWVGSYASAFMLTGLGVRMAKAWQINLEKSTDVLCNGSSDGQLHWSSRAARRRLM
ncbi:uncharacterized protein BCR38DRAFT_409086 [Pseudomassariella vexata]|uniref:Zn(2)-C6 fungal-type domain-containing protein n=1 Tax=Pseudomassariella vexata TaxID=1141098 RepID=A0A1Y2E1F5_9PEZI|nr:uncharacterized protein BCR38DRAFT_409086 [Pseudomassariella vexata]ORY65381.1 hypothetical protein BCR38DRAFT_409086 [Pseudomassariella vexata]